MGKLDVWLIITLVSLTTFVSEGAYAQSDKLTEADFTAEGLQFEDILTDFFRGDFIDIPFNRDEMTFAGLLNAYIVAYDAHCDGSLPPDKIELTRKKCAREWVTRNVYGAEISSECLEWEEIPTGIYASPEMFHAQMVIEGLQSTDALRNVFGMLAGKDPIGDVMSLTTDQLAVQQDMEALVRINGCDSPGLMRFQENLRLFALNKQPIPLEGDQSRRDRIASLSANQNYRQLVEDLVYQQSKSWVMNRFQRGSVSGVTISSSDNEGRPIELQAYYRFQGFSGLTEGSVRVTFSDGLPDCLYFSDFPRTCRTADRKIVAEFSKGGYGE